jgi:hypothetical protein
MPGTKQVVQETFFGLTRLGRNGKKGDYFAKKP